MKIALQPITDTPCHVAGSQAEQTEFSAKQSSTGSVSCLSVSCFLLITRTATGELSCELIGLAMPQSAACEVKMQWSMMPDRSGI